ncbi:Proteasome component Ecm29 [Aspergillus sclerotialis]|uniref:Proteasome component Ecm29 n=1 Tax=Aspergillus sclerotialis TaxID=2070753 RepID=A0A3A3A4C7_9EURO|nr:Proteasome component Ecm29 [Aspergillus sclerotialis]
MASDTVLPSSEARELSLISKVELRIALADSDEKLQTLLNTYLTPLLLKLGSESLSVRNKVISVCHHLNTRLKAPSIKLPVASLLSQFKEQKSQLIKHFDLVYLQQGIDRLGSDARVEVLFPLLQGISKIETPVHSAIIFNLVLRLLPLLKLPPKGSEDDVQLRHVLGLTNQDTEFLSSWFERLLILSPADKNSLTCPGLSPAEYAFLNKDCPVTETFDPSTSGGMNLAETKVACLRFLSSGAFADSERLLPAIVASSDTNSRISELGEEILKRFTPDLEDQDVIQRLYSLYFGSGQVHGTPPARISLQIKVLSFLGKSIRATSDTRRIDQLIEQGLLSNTARSAQGLQASKLRTQIFTFITWVVRMGSPIDLKQMLPKVITALRDFIQSQGWPSPNASGKDLPATDLSLRSLAYESIGIMVPKVDFRQEELEARFDFDLIRWLFMSLSLDDSSSQIFVSIEQALGGFLNSSLIGESKEFQESLRPFLVRQMDSRPGGEDTVTGFRIVRGSQYAAVRFANRFLPYHDATARWIDLVAIARGSERQQEIVEEGEKGLHPYWYRLLYPRKTDYSLPSSSSDGVHDPWYNFPSFTEMSEFLFESVDLEENSKTQNPSTLLSLSGSYRTAFAPAITFLRNILLWESFSKFGIMVEVEQEWDHKLEVLLSSDEKARLALKQYIQISDKSSVLIFLKSALDGFVSESREEIQQCGLHFVEICSSTSNDVLQALLPWALTLKGPVYSYDRDRQSVAARAIGILVSHPAFPDGEMISFITELSNTLAQWETAIGEAVLKVRGAILAVSYLLSRLAFRKLLQKVPHAQMEQILNTIFDILETSRDSLLRQAAQTSISQLSLSAILLPTMVPELRWKSIKERLLHDAKAESEVSIMAIGLLSRTFTLTSADKPQFDELLCALYSLHETRSPEVHFSVGDALSNAAVGWSSKSLAREFDVDEEIPESGEFSSVLAGMCDKVIADTRATKPSLRKASAIWLLCLVNNCGHMRVMQERLRKCQAAFTSLLADRDELVQESGAQGLSLVYEMGDQALKYDLVQDLVNFFTSNNAGLGGGRVNTNTELFEPGALPTGEGSSANTYKDIMNLASEAGDPTLVYRFMSLASNNAIWTNRAAFSKLGISSIFSHSSINGYLAKNSKIYPKLFRYRFDPNTNVQRSMNIIWHTLVKDSVAVVNAHFDEIMVDLLTSMMTGREWRARQASCTAISDLIQSHRPDKYVTYMDEIFTKAFKLLDDIKESVRVAALGLCQSITNVVVRTLETSDTNTNRARTMLNSTIPFLLSDKGIASSVQEVQGFAISALIRMIKKSPRWLLRPFVPHILEEFLNLLSSLEPQAVNYVHLNADKYGLTGQEIDKMRLSSIRTSPMMEVMERYLIDDLDETCMKEFAPKLEGVIRSAVGLPSKVGCSRVLVLLSMRTALFQVYADRFLHLLRKCVVDRNDTVSSSYCTSLGYLIRLGSDGQVLKTVEYAKDLYMMAEDASHRVISGELLHAMSKLSNDRFMAFATTALPFIFVSKNDVDDHVREIFERIWQENVGGSRTVSLYIREIVCIISSNLDSPRWAIKHTAALAIANAIMSLGSEIDIATSELVWPALEMSLAGKTWDGKESVIRAFVRFVGHTKTLLQDNKPPRNLIKVIAIREAKRNNPKYRPHALSALGEISKARDDLNFMPDTLSIVSGVLDSLLVDRRDEMDIDSDIGHNKPGQNEILATSVKCLLQCFNPRSCSSAAEGRTHSESKEYLTRMTSMIGIALGDGGRHVQITLYEELQAFFIRIHDWVSQDSNEKTDLRKLEEPLTGLAEQMFSRQIDASIERIRKNRAQAALAYISLSQQVRLMVFKGLDEFLKTWRDGERSRPVQETLEEALCKLV